MARQIRTVIIHGWSDCSESFADLKGFLAGQGIGPVNTIYYADYESREDNITYDDVADGLNDRFIEEGFVDADGKALVDLNVIVHSTGGLVLRHWIARYYLEPTQRIDLCPVRRIVMLAPANFGSPLAHRGKSFLGSLFKGRWKIGDLLEVGRNLLNGLELGSPYQWQLAHRDLLSGFAPYSAERIQLTILVGIEDYTGLRGWVNKPGTDGTVVIAGTSLDTLKLVLDCTKTVEKEGVYEPYSWSQSKAVDDFAFGVLPGLNHGTIVSDASKENAPLGTFLVRALSARSSGEFRELAGDLKARTETTIRESGRGVFQQFIVHAVDDAGFGIPDFTLEFFICRADRDQSGVIVRDQRLTAVERDLSDQAQAIMAAEFHPHSVDHSYRRFLVDLPAIKELLARAISNDQGLGGAVALSMRVYVPRIDRGIEYRTDKLQNIVLYRTDERGKGPTLLYENTTTLLELRIDRCCDYVTLGLNPRPH